MDSCAGRRRRIEHTDLPSPPLHADPARMVATATNGYGSGKGSAGLFTVMRRIAADGTRPTRKDGLAAHRQCNLRSTIAVRPTP